MTQLKRCGRDRIDAGGGLTTYDWYPTGEMRQMSPVGRDLIYGYDADGERVAAYDDSIFPGPQDGISYSLRGLDNKVRRDYIESNSAWMWSKDYVYRGGQLLASISRDPDIATRHYHLDHLGTPRAHTSAVKAQTSKHTYYPFGEEATNPIQEGSGQVNERMRFTGHERDLVSLGATMDDLDYMHARYYSPVMGRFGTLDAENGLPGRPQSWNRYAYTLDNPLRYVDPSGAAVMDAYDLFRLSLAVELTYRNPQVGKPDAKILFPVLSGKNLATVLSPKNVGVKGLEWISFDASEIKDGKFDVTLQHLGLGARLTIGTDDPGFWLLGGPVELGRWFGKKDYLTAGASTFLVGAEAKQEATPFLEVLLNYLLNYSTDELMQELVRSEMVTEVGPTSPSNSGEPAPQ